MTTHLQLTRHIFQKSAPWKIHVGKLTAGTQKSPNWERTSSSQTSICFVSSSIKNPEGKIQIIISRFEWIRAAASLDFDPSGDGSLPRQNQPPWEGWYKGRHCSSPPPPPKKKVTCHSIAWCVCLLQLLVVCSTKLGQQFNNNLFIHHAVRPRCSLYPTMGRKQLCLLIF